MDFEEDIRQHVLTNLPHQPAVEQELAAMDAQGLLFIFGNWLSRFVSARPRRVHHSSALLSNPTAALLAIPAGAAGTYAVYRNYIR